MTPTELGKRLGRIASGIGFVGPLLFYASSPSWFTWECRNLCPWCPYIDPVSSGLQALQLGLTMGLVSALLLAAIGFCGGYAVGRCLKRPYVQIH